MKVEKNMSADDKEEQWKKMLILLKRDELEKQIKGLEKCMAVIIKECHAETDKEKKFTFPDSKFTDVLIKLMSVNRDNSKLINKFHEFANHPDVIFHFWRCLPKSMLKEPQTNVYHMNVLELIEKMALPKNYDKPNFLDDKELLFENKDDFTFNYEIIKRNMNKVWSKTKTWKLVHNVHKKLLIVMVEHIMPHLQHPINWTDFLINSLNQQGSVAFLALQGVFKLMTSFNIEVPQIYAKLYNMFQPEVFHSRFKQRLFYLADLFLSSTHLPESMVASFIKRCSRLTLIAPAEDIAIMLYLIGDLMIRHPGLKKLIDHSSKNTDDSENKCKEDPFLADESDPMETKAIESSLWEIRTLERHMLPMVSSAAKFIKQNLPSVEFRVTSKLEETGEVIFNRELKRKFKDVALNFERPKKMALPKEDRIVKYWDLTV